MIPVYVNRLTGAGDIFQGAVSYEEFTAGYEGQRVEQFQKAYDGAAIPAEVKEWFQKRAREVGGTLRVLVVNENWCGDGLFNLAVLGRLARETGALEIKVLYRDAPENEELVEQHFLTTGKKKIPVIVFLDGNGDEIGRFASRTQIQEEAYLAGDIDFVREYYASGKYVEPVLQEFQQAAGL